MKARVYKKRGTRHEHRVVAEEKLGRPLRPGEIVHHKDENHRNNAPDNLKVLPSQAEHARLHFTGKPKPRPTHCKFGHPFVPGSFYTYPNGRRRCVICARDYDSAWKRAKRRERGLRKGGVKPGTPGAHAIAMSNARRAKRKPACA